MGVVDESTVDGADSALTHGVVGQRGAQCQPVLLRTLLHLEVKMFFVFADVSQLH